MVVRGDRAIGTVGTSIPESEVVHPVGEDTEEGRFLRFGVDFDDERLSAKVMVDSRPPVI